MAEMNNLLSGNDVLKRPKLDEASGRVSGKDIMADARAALSGNWGLSIVGYLLYGLFTFSLAFFVLAALIFVAVVSGLSGGAIEESIQPISLLANAFECLISGALVVGFSSFFLGIAQENEARLERLFTGFLRFWKSFAVYFFYGLFILLWSVLLIIPGIIATYRYAMAFFIIADDETCGPLEAIDRSKTMMKGNKWSYFCLQLRFIGWALLCIPLPIGWLWLVPYMQTSFAKFYEEVQ